MPLGNDVAMYALGYWAHERHPLRVYDFCLNSKQKRIPCAECSAVCPQEINIHEQTPQWMLCTNCNRCVPVCPTQAIHESSMSFDAVCSLIKTDASVVSLSCNRFAGQTDVKTECLGYVSWEMYAAIALKKKLVLKTSPCRDCDRKDCLRLFRETINQLKFFFGQEEFARRVLPKAPQKEKRIAGFAKRRAFTSAAGAVRGSVQQLTAEKGQSVSRYRATLLEVLESIPQEKRPHVHWRTLIEDGDCTGCGECARVCPHNAIKLHIPSSVEFSGLRDSSDGPVPLRMRVKTSAEELQQVGMDESAKVLIHDATACTQCGLCYLSCPEKTLGGWEEVRTNETSVLKAFPLAVRICGRCRRAYKPKTQDDILCASCSRFARH